MDEVFYEEEKDLRYAARNNPDVEKSSLHKENFTYLSYMKHVSYSFFLLTEMLQLILFWANDEYFAYNDVEELHIHII